MAGPAFLAARDGGSEMDWHEWDNHFDFYLATDWVITETGSGTRAISQADGGVLLITNAAADDDHNLIQLRDVASGQVAEHWLYSATKRMYFGARFKVSDATQSDFVMGLQVTDTSPLAVSDGIYFRKDDGDDDLDFIVMGSSVSTGSPTNVYTVVDDTYMVLEWMYNGDGNFAAFVDGNPVGGVDVDNAPATELTVSFAIQNGAAAAKSMSIDWIKVAKER